MPSAKVASLTCFLAGKDSWLVLASDGLFANEERGGGGGLTNGEVAQYIKKNTSTALEDIAGGLAAAAQSAGSTDDVTVLVAKLA